MIVNSAPQNEAILSNVGEIGEFRIRNSAKAFSILSSGLYANKIRAIIRELSTNARDSHKDAGRPDLPFDVHIPTALEPWFSIRDYGTGLTHEQVVNIYTTYFESTKTNSNEFVGCLGLGSKSPFAVTENFTVTAIKDGVKGIYTAFINDHGVPSIARMTEEESDEPAGVEVRFAVEDRYDFDKYRSEASYVYRWFDVKPVVTGGSVDLTPLTYADTDIIPGVHTIANNRNSYAVMGGIAYPIDVPNADTNLGVLRSMLSCGLVMHFEIGDLDFQASREGLSYIPQTIEAIKNKLVALQAALTDRLAEEANKIECIWERTHYLTERIDQSLWKAAVEKYVLDNQFPTIMYSPGTYHHMRLKPFTFYEEELASKYNLVIKCFSKYTGNPGVTNHKPETEYDRSTASYVTKTKWSITPQMNLFFVKNNTKIGAAERARYHWRHKKNEKGSYRNELVYVLDAADRTKPALFDAFLAALLKPPHVLLADSLLKKEKAASTATGLTVSILKLVPKYDSNSYYRRYNSEEYVWRDAGKAADYQNTTVYYLPLSGYTLETKYGIMDAKELREWVESCGIKSLQSLKVYGVRKSDIENIKKLPNWVNLEDHIKDTLSKSGTASVVGMAINSIDNDFLKKYNADIVDKVDDRSPYKKFVQDLKGVSAVDFNERSLKSLSDRYVPGLVSSVKVQVEQTIATALELSKRYPLLRTINYRAEAEHIAEYINLIDSKDI